MSIGRDPVEVQELTRAIDRISFLYVDRCAVSRSNNAVTFTTERNTVHVPAAMIGAVLLGHGTTISHAGISLLTDSGTSLVWCGDNGVRFYACGTPLAKTSRWLERQAGLVSNQRSRLDVARAMYAMRFPGEEVSGLTMQQLRGREGARVRQVYRECSEQFNVPWRRREYDPKNFSHGDPINQALSAANACLYGAIQAVILSLGLSPALGFIHNGHHRAFVYDIADLYKADVTIPLAFRVAGSGVMNGIGSATRKAMRDELVKKKVLDRAVADVKTLLASDELVNDLEGEVVYLWDERVKRVSGGHNYGDM